MGELWLCNNRIYIHTNGNCLQDPYCTIPHLFWIIKISDKMSQSKTMLWEKEEPLQWGQIWFWMLPFKKFKKYFQKLFWYVIVNQIDILHITYQIHCPNHFAEAMPFFENDLRDLMCCPVSSRSYLPLCAPGLLCRGCLTGTVHHCYCHCMCLWDKSYFASSSATHILWKKRYTNWECSLRPVLSWHTVAWWHNPLTLTEALQCKVPVIRNWVINL